MNFYNEDEDKKGAPVMPSTASPFKKTSAFGKTPMFARATGSIIDRLKNLSRKDMAFVGIGLSVLVMAPVAEYMMSQPAQDNILRETFNPRSGPGGVIDPGINGLSTGSSDGSGEVITPLSSRDPMSLILGAQPAAAVMPPPSAPPTTSYRDAMKESGRAAFTEASKSAGAPTVIPRLQAALRGISSFGGDSGGSRTSGVLGGGKIIDDARSASAKAKSRSMVGPVAMAGYKGVASNTPNSSSRGAFEKLRAQADRSAGNFSGGSAMNSLDKAAADAANISGSGGLGAGTDSEKIKGGSGSTTKYDHNRSGESLAEAAAKARQQKALEWEFFKKYEFKKQLLTAVFGAISTEVGKFVGGAVGGALNPPGKAPEPQFCYLKDGPGGTWVSHYNIKDCGKDKPIVCNPDCMVRPAGWNGSDAPTTTPPGTTPPGTTDPGTIPPGGQNPASAPAVKDTFTDYDVTLKMMLENIQAGVKAADPLVLLDNTIAITGGFGNLKVDSVVVAKVKGGVIKVQNGEIGEYERNIGEARTNLAAAKADYSLFKTQFDAVKKAADEGKLVAGTSMVGGVSQSADISAAVKPYLAEAEASLAAFEKNYVARADELIALNQASLEVFKNQAGRVTAAAEAVSSDYTGNVIAATNEAKKELEGMKSSLSGQGGKLTIEQHNRLIESFKAISGLDSGVKPQTPVPPVVPTGDQVVASNPLAPIDYRDAVGAAQAPLITKPLAWRGLPSDIANAMADGKLNDADSIKAEKEAWVATSPKGKQSKDQLADLDNMAKENLLAGSMRGSAEIPTDVKASLMDPNTAADLVRPVNEKTEAIRKQLTEKWHIDMANPTGGATGTNPGTNPGNTPAVNDPLVGRQTALLANSRNIGSDYQAATAVHAKLGSGTNAQYARSDYRKMTDNHANIVRLTNELSAPGAKPTKEKLDELEMYQTNFNKAYGDFQTHAKASGAPVAVKPQPQVIINNNVSANANANATAGSNSAAIVKPTTNNNTTNNTTVNNNKPPVVVPPVIQPAKPIEPSPNLRVPMLDGNSMTMSRAEFYPNTGTALYKGFYRESGSYLLIVAKTAYNYQTTCSRSGTTYKISKVEAAPVAFPANEKTGWVMELLIKKFLRISDIQFGRLYDVSSQRSDLIGKTCHQ